MRRHRIMSLATTSEGPPCVDAFRRINSSTLQIPWARCTLTLAYAPPVIALATRLLFERCFFLRQPGYHRSYHHTLLALTGTQFSGNFDNEKNTFHQSRTHV